MAEKPEVIVHTDIERFSATKPVVTLGMFDGVHLGHQFLLSRLRNLAEQLSGSSVVVSFWPHPRIVLDSGPNPTELLNTFEEKTELISRMGINHLIAIPFTLEISRWSSCEFIHRILVQQIGVQHLLAGFNHHFGRNREGNFSDISACAAQYGFQVERLPEFIHPIGHISSSTIRRLLTEGNLSQANDMMGRPFSLSGRVVEGDQIGRKLGFPTANLSPSDPNKKIPKPGVYAIWAFRKGEMLPGMMNIGTRPTLHPKEKRQTIEVHLFDFSTPIYEEEIRVFFIRYIREEKQFFSLEDLIAQIRKDEQEIRNILSSEGPPEPIGPFSENVLPFGKQT